MTARRVAALSPHPCAASSGWPAEQPAGRRPALGGRVSRETNVQGGAEDEAQRQDTQGWHPRIVPQVLAAAGNCDDGASGWGDTSMALRPPSAAPTIEGLLSGRSDIPSNDEACLTLDPSSFEYDSRPMPDALIELLPDLVLLMRRDGSVLARAGGHGVPDLRVPSAGPFEAPWSDATASLIRQLLRRSLAERSASEARFSEGGRDYDVRVTAQGPDRAIVAIRPVLPQLRR